MTGLYKSLKKMTRIFKKPELLSARQTVIVKKLIRLVKTLSTWSLKVVLRKVMWSVKICEWSVVE